LPKYVAQSLPVDKKDVYYKDLPGELIDAVWNEFLAVEFRHGLWFSEKHRSRTLAFEREHGITHVVVDEPQNSKSSVPAVWEIANADLAFVRLHGRNIGTWENKGLTTASERFDYWYEEPELKELVPSINALA
jgi:uncharacterized protein YecE (DUF72 family)